MGLFKAKRVTRNTHIHPEDSTCTCFLLLSPRILATATMQFPEAMMHDRVWFDRPKYVEAREHYELFLANNLTLQVSKAHEPLFTEATKAVAEKAGSASSSLVNEIEKARQSIRQTLKGESSVLASSDTQGVVDSLKCENEDLKKLVKDLASQIEALTVRVSSLEKGAATSPEPTKPTEEKKKPVAADDDDDSDFDMFGSDSEEESEADKKRKEELVAKYKEKKAKKPALVAKSSITLDVKPWDDETDMKEMERLVRTVETDGLVWGSAKLVPLAYGIKKLQIVCVVEDDKVGTDYLEEKITEFEDLVQSVDIAAFNKI